MEKLVEEKDSEYTNSAALHLRELENSIPVDDVRKLVDSLRGNHSSYPCLNTDSKCVVCMALEQFTAKHGSKLNKEKER